ncbi:MAG: energy transducer TonB [Methylococcaceae bacterium]|jgi:protein TonB
MTAFQSIVIDFPMMPTTRATQHIREVALLKPLTNTSGLAFKFSKLPVLRTRKKPQTKAYGLAFGLALSLHLLWLGFSGPATKTPKITPPKPIQVAWLSTQDTATAKPQQTEQPKTLKPEQKPVAKTKPQALKPPKAKTLIANANQSVVTTQVTDLAPSPPIAEKRPVQPMPTATPPASSHPSTEAVQSPPHLNADYLDNPKPNYPAISRELGEQGRVLLRALINTDGSVANVAIRTTSGYSRLDQAACDSVKQWRFVPARQGDQAVSAWVVVPVTFSLEG